MSLGRETSQCRPEVCSLIRGIKNAGSPWHLIVAAYLLDGPRRFNELLGMGENDSLNARTLSRALKHLVGHGFVSRDILATQPFAVQYSLTSQGDRLRKLLRAYRELDDLSNDSAVESGALDVSRATSSGQPRLRHR